MPVDSKFSIYVHIPYCIHKCPYCDFNTYAVALTPEKEYLAALLCELDYRANQSEWSGRTVQTIFFGGGTPSLFSGKSILKIISSICNLFPVDPKAEITLEANPGTVTTESLTAYKQAGVNRLSLGAQSFNPATLKTLGRMHTPAQTECAVAAAKVAGFNNINLDLIFGVDTQSVADLRADLIQATRLDPQHISTYCLTIEKGTDFFTRYKKGLLKAPTEDNLIEMMQVIESILSAHEYERYEISNFAKKGKQARHNLAYWNGNDYIGLGAGAHSFFAESANKALRWSNFAIPKEYMEKTSSQGHADSWSEELQTKDLMFEFFFLGLRKTNGVDLNEFHQKFGFTVEAAYPSIIEILSESNLAIIENNLLRLTDKGLMLQDSVVEHFIYSGNTLPNKTFVLQQSEPLVVNGQIGNAN